MMEIVRNVNLDLFVQFRIFYKRVSNFGNEMMRGHGKIWGFQTFNGLVAIGSLVSFVVAMSCAFLYLFPRVPPVVHSYGISNSTTSVEKCNVFEGRWIPDESYPLYNASQCPFAEIGFNCLANGRKDKGYAKWRWKPKNCDIPRFDVRAVLETLRGKRIVFVGDSLGRTQWESLICLLMTGVEDKKSVYEVNGNKITKRIRFLAVRFSSFDLRIDFYRSVFLVQPASAPNRAPKRGTGGHQVNFLKYRGCYFQEGKSLKLGMPITTAFKTALNTWASWAETMINTNRTSVFFRSFETSHWSGRNHNSCKVTHHPLSSPKGRDQSSISNIIIKIVRKMTVPVTVLHVTPMVATRSDGHVGTWSDNPSVPDCSHWCLPGVPDMWNEILLSYLLPGNDISLQ
ncbi:hypothetical protein CerSpe_269030 [Prunus speciosa]